MSNIEILNTLVSYENILSIFRNYYSFDRVKQKKITFLIISLTLIYVVAGIEFITHTNRLLDDANLMTRVISVHIFTTAPTINAIIPVITAIKYTDCFKILLKKMNYIHRYCKGAVVYDEKMKMMNKYVKTIITLLLIIYSSATLINFLQWIVPKRHKENYVRITLGSFHTLLRLWKEVCAQLEILIFNVFIRIIFMSLSHLNINLRIFSERIKRSKGKIDDAACSAFLDDFRKWIIMYNRLVLCCEKLRKGFGCQMTFSLFIITLYCIALGYMCILLAKNENCAGWFTLVLLINYTIAMVSLLYSAQRVRNEADRLKILTNRLYNTLLESSNGLVMRSLVKDFNRQISVRPIEIQVLSTTTLGMGALLSILSIAISYTIILLQFNHIV